jgi:hypothetical protein
MGCFEAGAITCGNFDCLCALFSTCQRNHWFHPYIHFFVVILVEVPALRSPCNGADQFLTVDGISECSFGLRHVLRRPLGFLGMSSPYF